MAGRGPAPSVSRSRSRDQRRAEAAVVEVVADDVVRGPELPERDPLGLPWPAQTRRWWESWRRSPLAVTFAGTDWDYLTDTAVLHAALWRGDVKAAAELRLRVALFGATPADRARLRLSVKSPAAGAAVPEARAAAAAASSASKRRSRILKAVTDGAADVG